ncbi:MAG: hypothetical protein IKU63_02105 [Bacteroidaceae bacterium]|nr:hypothetical protein [Bacteroidaceae bacterium]
MSSRLSGKDKAFVAISFFFIIYSIFPLFANVTGIPVFIPALVVVGTLLLLFPKAFMGISTKWFIAYIGVLILYIILGKPIFINGLNQSLPPLYRIIIEAAWILPNITIMNVLLYKNDVRLFRVIGYGSIGLLVASFLYILPKVMESANYLRDDLGDIDVIRPVGLPGYDLMHAYTLMILPLCLLVKHRTGRNRYWYLALLLLFAYMVTRTAVTTSLVVMSVAVLFVFLFDVNRQRRTLLRLGIVLLFGYVLYKYGFFLMFADGLMPYFEDTAVSFKLQDLHTSMTRGQITGETLTGRMDYHEISKDAFWENPIIGSDRVGGHSKILDILGSMGLLSFIPYFMILYSSLKRYAFRLKKDVELKPYLYFSFLLACVYLYTKGIFGNPGYLFMLVIVPSILISINSLNKKK